MHTQTALAEQTTGQPLIADERFRDREASFATIPQEAPRLSVCSDERRMSPDSWLNLVNHYGIDQEVHYNRDFGGIHGDTFDFAVAVAAMNGPEALRAFAGDPETLARDVKQTIQSDNQFAAQEGFGEVFAVDHSDDHSEHNSTDLNLEDKEGGLGCLFNKKFGTVLGLAATNRDIQAEAREAYVAQSLNPAIFDAVVEGARGAFEVLLNNNGDYGVSRKDAAALADRDSAGKPVAAILTGDHFAVEDVVEIANYVPNSGAKPDDAHPAFVTDMTDKTLQLCRAFQRQGLTLNPEYVFAVKELKRAVVRFALSGGKVDTMAHTSRGNAQQGLAYVREQLGLAA